MEPFDGGFGEANLSVSPGIQSDRCVTAKTKPQYQSDKTNLVERPFDDTTGVYIGRSQAHKLDGGFKSVLYF